MRPKRIGDRLFIFAESTTDPIETQFAALEYRLEGYCCRVFDRTDYFDIYVSVTLRTRRLIHVPYKRTSKPNRLTLLR